MGSITYDYLNNSFLFRQEDIESKYSSYSNKELEDEIDKYVEFITTNIGDLERESLTDSDLKIFSSTKHQPLSYLTQSALYFDQYIIQDPLFELSTSQTKTEENIGRHVGYMPLKVDRYKISKSCEYLKSLTPMIAANYLKLFPINHFTRSKWDGMLHVPPIEEEKSQLPKHLEDFFWNELKLNNLQYYGEGKYGLNPHEDFTISRAIHVSFGEDELSNGNMYHLTQLEISPQSEDGKVTIRSYLPETLPSKEEFHNWVNQSVNKSAFGLYSNTTREVELSEKLNATFLTDSSLKYKLLNQHVGKPQEDIKSFATSSFLNYDVPFIENLDVGKLMDLKQNDGDTFANFRVEFQKQIRELRGIDDNLTFQRKIEDIYHEFYEVQVLKIQQKMDQVSRQMKATAIISLASLIPAIPTGGLSLFGLMIAGANGFKTFDKYYSEAKNNPAFLLWKTKKSR